ncbi:MAG: DUF2851 family protein [Sodaliphilus sp.]|nr:DUF2851 family protein [Muribaculaceae bacterium]MCI7031806.1 DUF2851 family protein [Bacteroidales bacterium]MDY3008344.1 DUF2851 family protein [Sodaliphilus sp.]MCI7317524.1 DUF2851 family protein [Bacteroidales bacterium]MCI7470933.1 DUF2851 family protein [Bacteroidales bacterium]
MEKLMQYVWKHRLWRSEDMVTNTGKKVRVVDPGLLNTDAGPDFFNAKIEIDGHMWVGNVEMHYRATDWKRHHHDSDKAYDSVILHVVAKDDAPVRRTNGELIPQLVLEVSPQFNADYASLVGATIEVPCATKIKQVPHLTIVEWVEGLAFERLHGKVERIHQLLDSFNGSWEDVCYVTLARNFGFGINNDAFERLARRTPLRLLGKHSDSVLQIEALLFGQAGMLDAQKPGMDSYYNQLCTEYAFLSNKFQLTPMEKESWKLFRIRPQNFPYRRIAMLAQFIEGGFRMMNRILEAEGEKEMRALFEVELSGYWTKHYTFGKPNERATATLSRSSTDIILINTVAPLLYAYGELTGNYEMTDKAIKLLEDLRAESNSIVSHFVAYGIDCPDALTSQALVQLKREYCDARKCIYCKIGHHLLSKAARGE